MARYIDMDKLSKMIEVRAEQLIEGKEALLYVAKWLNLLPEADVVPKSEVDLYRKQVDELEDELAQTYDKLEEAEAEVERLTYLLHCYALQYGTVKDQQKVIDKAKAEVAREIFAEIEKICVGMQGYTDYTELKKKYTEESNEV